jgi:hypothetical protein
MLIAAISAALTLTQLLGFERVRAQKMLKIREFCEAVSFCGAKTPIDSVGVTRA